MLLIWIRMIFHLLIDFFFLLRRSSFIWLIHITAIIVRNWSVGLLLASFIPRFLNRTHRLIEQIKVATEVFLYLSNVHLIIVFENVGGLSTRKSQFLGETKPKVELILGYLFTRRGTWTFLHLRHMTKVVAHEAGFLEWFGIFILFLLLFVEGVGDTLLILASDRILNASFVEGRLHLLIRSAGSAGWAFIFT